MNRWMVPPQVRPDGEGLVVAVAEGDQAPVAGLEDVEGLAHHRPLDAAAGHRAGDLAVVGHGHGRAGQAGAGALDVDHPGQRHPLALATASGRGRS